MLQLEEKRPGHAACPSPADVKQMHVHASKAAVVASREYADYDVSLFLHVHPVRTLDNTIGQWLHVFGDTQASSHFVCKTR
jgi:hypothetical protein